MDYYKILKVGRNASSNEIRSAYRSLARSSHPDRTHNESSSNFRKIRNAYETLSDPEKKREYDQTLSSSIPIRIIESEDKVEEVRTGRKRDWLIREVRTGSRPQTYEITEEMDLIWNYLFRRLF